MVLIGINMPLVFLAKKQSGAATGLTRQDLPRGVGRRRPATDATLGLISPPPIFRMLLLYQSNRLEQLGQLFCGMSQSLPLSDPFAPETVIVQSRGMGRW
ncbi:hypothetical protein C3F00_037455, partial [Pseudomonas sp. MWU13-2860]